MLLWQGNSTYDTEADKRRLRNIRHDNKQDIDFWKLCIIKQENTQDNKQDETGKGLNYVKTSKTRTKVSATTK